MNPQSSPRPRPHPTFRTAGWLAILPVLLLLVAGGCRREERNNSGQTANTPATGAPTAAEAGNVTLRGLEGDSESVTLRDGRWEGPPYAAGGASRPSVYLVRGFLPGWNADGEGPEEAVALVNENSGGSGEYVYLVLLSREGGRVVNRATALLGDRVQVVAAEPAGRTLKLTLLRSGPEGELCCPDEVATEEWELRGGTLTKRPGSAPAHPLTLDLLQGVEWTFAGSASGDGGGAPGDAGAAGTITLRYADGKFQGHSGCNRYFAGVAPGELPGDLSLGPVASTRMACPDSAANALEALYLARLGSAVKFGFSATRLMLMYEGAAGSGVLYYRRP